MKASFGADVKSLTKSNSVWMDDASYKDVSGRSTFTQKETDAITKILSDAGRTFKAINGPMLRKFMKLQESMTGAMMGASYKTYNNSKVRQGQKITNPKQHANGYLKWVEDNIQKQIDKVKTLMQNRNTKIYKNNII